MKISTRGRYALRVVVDLAEHANQQRVPLKDIADRQEISLKYLESIMTDLSKAGIVLAQHGKGGGYKLAKNPDSCRVSDVLLVAEGDLAPVSCLEHNAAPCPRAAECKTLGMWKKLHETVMSFFNGVTIADLVGSGNDGFDYVI